METFKIRKPEITDPLEIERLSLETICAKATTYSKFNLLKEEEQKVVIRMIHATTCFDNILNNIIFTPDAILKIKGLLHNEAIIITDTNMIKSGISASLTEKYNNKVICNVGNEEIKNKAAREGVTRTVAAVKNTLKQFENKPMILACGNAPTFLYAAIEYIVHNQLNIDNIAFIAMPVGFINVLESKEYTIDFIKHTGLEGVVLNGQYGGSTLVVSCLHAIYKLLN